MCTCVYMSVCTSLCYSVFDCLSMCVYCMHVCEDISVCRVAVCMFVLFFLKIASECHCIASSCIEIIPFTTLYLMH